ncbi:SPOR domain-containing protein [Pseudoroseomonas wenyumeiae]
MPEPRGAETGGSVRRVVSRPVPPPRPAARSSSAPAGNWAVQVGAFADRGPAQAAARKAAARGGKMEVERVRVKGNWFWRARVTGISPAAARATCGATRGPCMVLSPSAQ